MILGLDISTSSTGYCLLSTEGIVIEIGYIILSNIKDSFSKAQRILDKLSELNLKHDIKKIFVEENLQAFRPGLSSAKTLLTLSRFNGVVCYICERDLLIKPEFINVNFARKTVGFKVDRKSKISTKDQVCNWALKDINNNLTNFEWPTKILKSGPRKGQTVIIKNSYDMADAYVIAKSSLSLI